MSEAVTKVPELADFFICDLPGLRSAPTVCFYCRAYFTPDQIDERWSARVFPGWDGSSDNAVICHRCARLIIQNGLLIQNKLAVSQGLKRFLIQRILQIMLRLNGHEEQRLQAHEADKGT